MPPSVPPARVVLARVPLGVVVPEDLVVGLAPPPRRRPRSRRRSRRPSSPGCSSAPARAARRSCGPSGRASRGRAATPYPSTSTTPPSESPAFAAASTSAIIAASASASKQRTCDASTGSRSAGFGRRSRGRRAPGRAATTWLMTCVPRCAEQQLRERPGCDPGRRLPGAGPLEDVAGVVEAVLLHADEVGVAGAGLAQRACRRARGGRHLLLPLGPLGVADHDRDRRAQRPAVADAAEELDARPARSACGGRARSRAGAGRARPRRRRA